MNTTKQPKDTPITEELIETVEAALRCIARETGLPLKIIGDVAMRMDPPDDWEDERMLHDGFRGGRWTREEEAILVARLVGGISYVEIAEELDRTYIAVTSRASVLRRRGML